MRKNNFYSINDKDNINIRQNTEDNYYGNNYPQYNMTESRTYNKNNINSPYVNEKRNFMINSDLRFQDKQYNYESASKNLNNDYSINKRVENNQNIQNNIINKRNITDINTKYNTEYNTQENEIIYYNELQSKIYKKVMAQFYKNLRIYCLKLLIDDWSYFLKIVKDMPKKNHIKQKAYMKKNIVNKNIYKLKKTPDKIAQNQKYISTFISPFANHKTIKKDKNKFISQNTSVNNSNKKKVIFSNYYNLNIYENNTNNKYIYSNKRNQARIQSELTYDDKNKFTENNPNLNSIDYFKKNNDNNVNVLYNYANRKNMFKTTLKKNANFNFTQPKNYQNLNSSSKNDLKIDNKKSMEFLNSTKKKIIDKLQNIKLFRQASKNNNNSNTKLISEEEDLEKKKYHFQNLMGKLKDIAFVKHIEKFIEFNNTKIKKEFLEVFKQNNKISDFINENKNEKIINNENNDNNQINNNIENDFENNDENNNIKLNKENILDKEEIIDNNQEDYNKIETNEIKDIKISYEKIEKKERGEQNINNEENINSKEEEILSNKNENDKNINNDNNLKINLETTPNNILNNEDIIINENIENNKEICIENSITPLKKEEIENDVMKDKNEKNIIEQINKEGNKEKEKSNKEEISNKIIGYFKNLNNNIQKDEEKNNDNIENDNNKEEENIKEVIKNDEISSEEKIKNNKKQISDILQKIINNIIFKEKINTLKIHFNKWRQIILDKNKMELGEEKENLIENNEKDINKSNNKPEDDSEHKGEKRNIMKIKTLFFDEADEEEKKDILEEMIFRFRTLLMSSCFINKEYISDFSD